LLIGRKLTLAEILLAQEQSRTRSRARKAMSSGNSTSPLVQSPPHHAAPQPSPGHAQADHEVKVWVRDGYGLRYGVKMLVSSDFNDVMQKFREKHGPIPGPGPVVGFEGGDEFTTVSEMLRAKPASETEEAYLRDNPIQPKFKKVRRVLNDAPVVLKRML